MTPAPDTSGEGFNPPAFPSPHPGRSPNDGMTLRDWFAGRAMQSIITASATLPNLAVSLKNNAGVAVSAYEMADAMLEARKVQP